MLVVEQLAVVPMLGPVSFTACRGEVLGIIGPNGAGKSSLLKALSGHFIIDSGTATLQGDNLARLTPKQRARRMALLSQKTDLAFDLPVEQVIELGLFPYHYRARQRRRLVRAVMQAHALGGLAGWPYHRLSGGQQQRVQLARVFAQLTTGADNGHKLLLLDEHVSHLDPYYQHHSFQAVRHFAQHYQQVAIAVAHDLQLAARYADRLLLLHQGRLLDQGSPRAVLTDTNMRRSFGMSLAATPPAEAVYLCMP